MVGEWAVQKLRATFREHHSGVKPGCSPRAGHPEDRARRPHFCRLSPSLRALLMASTAGAQGPLELCLLAQP